MCDPVSLALTAATSLAQGYMQNKGANAVNKATIQAQDKFNQDLAERRNLANIQLQDSIQQAGTEKDTTRYDKAVAERAAANQPKFDQKVLLPGQGSASGAVRTAIVQAQNNAQAKNTEAALNDAKLQAYGDAALGRDIALGQNSNRINTQGSFVQGGLNNLQADSAAAARAGDYYTGIADMIGGVGSLANTGYALSQPGLIPVAGTGTSTTFSPNGVPIPGRKPDMVKNPINNGNTWGGIFG